MVVVFTSDNGPWLPFESHSGSAGLLRNGKATTWEGGQRVPGIFWGGDIKPGIISDLGSTMDIFPTLLEMSNTSMVNDRIIDGVSIKNTLLKNKMLNTQKNLGTRKVFYNGNKLIKKYLKQEYSLGYMNF